MRTEVIYCRTWGKPHDWALVGRRDREAGAAVQSKYQGTRCSVRRRVQWCVSPRVQKPKAKRKKENPCPLVFQQRSWMSQKMEKKLDFPPPLFQPSSQQRGRCLATLLGAGFLGLLSCFRCDHPWKTLPDTSRNKALLAIRPFISPSQIGTPYQLLHVYYIHC